VVLFDEIEKANPDVFNVLLQVLDDGRLTDNKGRLVNFKNTIIIMTSNMGSSLIRERMEHLTAANRTQVIESTKREVLDMLKQNIRPEFLNRIDEIIMFTPLGENEIREIVNLQMRSVAKSLAKSGVTLSVTDAAIDYLAKVGYDPEFGARPVKRAIQRLVLNELSKDILADKVNRDKPIVINANSDGLTFKN
jgi:ATP-dependent Clp protease ATP-binding subunit ClpB